MLERSEISSKNREEDLIVNNKVNTSLNNMLSGALAATCQYMMLSEMCDSQDYKGFNQEIENHAVDDIHFAEWLIQRILVFKGLPDVARLNLRKIGKKVPASGINTRDEYDTRRAHQAAINLAQKLNDRAAASLLRKILRLERTSFRSKPYTHQIEPWKLTNGWLLITHQSPKCKCISLNFNKTSYVDLISSWSWTGDKGTLINTASW
jgi:bacterioferritin